MEKIVENINNSKSLQRLIINVKKQLDLAPEKIKEATKLFFIDKKPAKSVATTLGISERTVYRLIARGEEYLAQNLGGIGINFLTFRQILANHEWIRDIYNRLAAQV